MINEQELVIAQVDATGDFVSVELAGAYDVDDFESALEALGIAAPKPFVSPANLEGLPFFITDAIEQPFSEADPSPVVLCTIRAVGLDGEHYLSMGLQTQAGDDIKFRRGILRYFESVQGAAKALGPCVVKIINKDMKNEFTMIRSFMPKQASLQTVQSQSRPV